MTILLLLAPALAATTPLPEVGLVVDRWGAAEGLPVDHVNDLAIGKDGRLWLATVEGLWTFDGARFQPEVPGLADAIGTRRIFCVEVSPDDGALWVMGEGLGVARITEAAVQSWRKDAAFGEMPIAFSNDEHGLWLQTERRLYQLTDRPVPWRPELFEEPLRGQGLDADGARWLGFPDGVIRVDRDGSTQRMGVDVGLDLPLADLRGLVTGGPWARSLDGTSQIWSGDQFLVTGGAARGPEVCQRLPYLYGPACPPRASTGRWQVGPRSVLRDGVEVLQLDADARMALEDPSGSLWIASTAEGLLRIRDADAQVLLPDGDDPRVTWVWLDEAGVPWFGDPLRSPWHMGEGGPVHLRLSPDEVGTEHGGSLRRVGGATLLTSAIGWFQLLGPPDETLFKARRIEPSPDFAARASVEDSGGRSWIAIPFHGLWTWEAGELQRWPKTPENDDITALAALPDGSLAVGIRGRGLARLVGESLEWVALDAGQAQNIRHLRIEGRRLWVASEDDGLCIVPDVEAPVGSWALRCLGLTQGLPARGAHQSLADGRGRTWVSTNQGVGVAETAVLDAFADGDLDHVDLLRFGIGEGMATAEANGGDDQALALDGEARIWVPTQRGAVSIDTRRFDLPSPPAVRFDLPPVGPLDAGHPPIELRWWAADLRWGEQVRYRTRVTGGPWRHVGRDRGMTLTSLPAGTTTVEVQAGLAGRWGPGASLALVRRPTFGETAWAPVTAGLLALILAGGVGVVRRQSLRRRARALEEEVRKRTAEVRLQAREIAVQRDTLEAQTRRLENLEELRMRMIVNLHHELRTPLALVLGPLREPAPGADDLALARANAERLGTLLDQLGEIALLEAGDTRVVARYRSLTTFARECAGRYHVMARERGVILQFQDRGELFSWFDGDLLERALSNLVHNALKFTPSGGTVTVGVAERPDGCELRVEDTGPGVDRSERDRIFERLYQVDRADTRAHEGSGLGLAISREVVELHGGAIGVEPAPGGGSAFWIRLPPGVEHLAPEDISVEAPAISPLPVGIASVASPDVVGTILVVEDSADMRAYLRAALSGAHHVIEAADGQRGLELAREARPDLVVSDVMMPRLDGVGLTRALRADPALAGTPVILVSAKTRTADRVEGLEVADAWLGKPFYLAELRAHVRRLLGRRALLAPSPSPSPTPAPPPPVPEADSRFADALRKAATARISDQALGLADLAQAVGMSERSLQRRTMEVFGLAPTDWLRELRLDEAYHLLQVGRYATVSEVAAAVGMSRAYFTRTYRARAGRSPGEDLRSARRGSGAGSS